MHIYSNFGVATKPVLVFIRRAAYRSLLNIQRVADAAYDQNFNRLFSDNLIAAVNTALPR
jgi:hypothetical protein